MHWLAEHRLAWSKEKTKAAADKAKAEAAAMVSAAAGPSVSVPDAPSAWPLPKALWPTIIKHLCGEHPHCTPNSCSCDSMHLQPWA